MKNTLNFVQEHGVLTETHECSGITRAHSRNGRGVTELEPRVFRNGHQADQRTLLGLSNKFRVLTIPAVSLSGDVPLPVKGLSHLCGFSQR